MKPINNETRAGPINDGLLDAKLVDSYMMDVNSRYSISIRIIRSLPSRSSVDNVGACSIHINRSGILDSYLHEALLCDLLRNEVGVVVKRVPIP
jgi:hypothetical protein